MSRLPDLISGFKLLRQVDLNAVRLQAERTFQIMVIGEDACARAALVEHLLTGPRSDEPPGLPPVISCSPDKLLPIPDNALCLWLFDAAKPHRQDERDLLDRLVAGKVPTIVCYYGPGLTRGQMTAQSGSFGAGAQTAVISLADHETLMRELAPAMLLASKGREVALARKIPMMRTPVARKLIDDACFINATYSLSTGLAEIVPVLDLSLNLADMVMLTKNQAMMAYAITLAMGMRAEWRDTMPKLAAVVGSAFLWRQLARSLAGLVPVIGIVPKIVISYAGTYVVGEAVYQWCANGEKLTQAEMRAAYAQAFARGSDVARSLLAQGDSAQLRVADRFKEIAQTIAEGSMGAHRQTSSRVVRSAMAVMAARGADARDRIALAAGQAFKPPTVCVACGRKAPRGAGFCAYCGKQL